MSINRIYEISEISKERISIQYLNCVVNVKRTILKNKYTICDFDSWIVFICAIGSVYLNFQIVENEMWESDESIVWLDFLFSIFIHTLGKCSILVRMIRRLFESNHELCVDWNKWKWDCFGCYLFLVSLLRLL